MSRTGRKDTAQYWNEPLLSPTDVKLQHYVPQLHLRAFANANLQIRVVDLEHPGLEYVTAVRDVAAETRFYDIHVGNATLSAETWLTKLEDSTAPILKRLIGDPDEILGLSIEEEMTLARFLATFRFRTPAFRDQMASMKQMMIAHAKRVATAYVRHNYSADEAERTLKVWAEQPDDWWLSNNPPAPPAMTTAMMLSEVQGFANLLWVDAMAHRPGSLGAALYTSDNSLAGLLPPVRPSWQTAAFASLRYYIPLSPDVLLQIDPRSRQSRNEGPGRRVGGVERTSTDGKLNTH